MGLPFDITHLGESRFPTFVLPDSHHYKHKNMLYKNHKTRDKKKKRKAKERKGVEKITVK